MSFRPCICGHGRSYHCELKKKRYVGKCKLCDCSKFSGAYKSPLPNDGIVIIAKPVIAHRPVVDEVGRVSCSCGSRI